LKTTADSHFVKNEKN